MKNGYRTCEINTGTWYTSSSLCCGYLYHLLVRPISPFSGISCDVKVVSIDEQAQNNAHHDNADQFLSEDPPASNAVTLAADYHKTDYNVVVNYDGKVY